MSARIKRPRSYIAPIGNSNLCLLIPNYRFAGRYVLTHIAVARGRWDRTSTVQFTHTRKPQSMDRGN